MQVARIVGRDTSALSAQEVRTAALETLAENLSDGVVAPLFWYLLLGVPGMLAYKMVNTLDSMVGYKNERYRRFGCFAARLDDVANYIPARLISLSDGYWFPVAFPCLLLWADMAASMPVPIPVIRKPPLPVFWTAVSEVRTTISARRYGNLISVLMNGL